VSFGGHATLLGGEGDDLFLIDGNAGAVLLDGGPGFDTVDLRWAEAGFLLDLATPTENTGAADVGALLNIEGAIGSLFYADTLLGNAAANALSGGGGDDSLDGRAGADTMIGGTGNDTYRVDQMGDLTIERAGGGFDIVLTTTSYRLAAGWEVEVLSADMEVAAVANANLNLWGSATANAITGTNGVNRLYGRDGHDTLNGLGGNDFLYGENGNDELRGGAGIDRLYGGAGNDALYGGDEADFLYGDAGQDTLFGEAANDQLYGGADADTLAGGDGNDTLFGEAGDDSLSGGDGNDILQGGPGFSLLIGGAGADVFVFDAAGFSRINDFSGPDDTIRLPQALVPVLPTGVLAAAAFSATAGGVTAATRIFLGPGYALAPNERTVNYDPDGSGPLAAIQIGVITNGATAGITNADFVVIA
jgi:Ca2+-binding RTX toxin-like protein